ncbi:MAG: hypothetical protein QM762_29310 [Chryseolinea sp.]
MKGSAGPIIFQNYKAVDRIMKLERKPFNHLFNYLKGWTQLQKATYDLVINVVHNSSSGRIAAQFARGRFKLFCEEDPAILEKHPDAIHMAKYPIYYLRKYLPADARDERPVPRVDMKLSVEELQLGAPPGCTRSSLIQKSRSAYLRLQPATRCMGPTGGRSSMLRLLMLFLITTLLKFFLLKMYRKA